MLIKKDDDKGVFLLRCNDINGRTKLKKLTSLVNS